MDLPGLLGPGQRPVAGRLAVLAALPFLLVSCQVGAQAGRQTPQAATATKPALALAENAPVEPSPTPSAPAPALSAGASPPATPWPGLASMPTNTAVPTATPIPTASPTPSVTPTASPLPTRVNGLTIDQFIVMPSQVRSHVQAIYLRGQALGRDAHAFSRLGASTVATTLFLTRFDSGRYNLGDYDYLQPAIDHFAGSYGRLGVAVRRGLTAWAVFSPSWASKESCQPDEDVLSCEIRLHNPGLILVVMGTNDTGPAADFEANMRRLIEETTKQGIIPVLLTKADRYEGPDNRNNNILRRLAAEYQIPLLDFDRLAGTLPDRGLTADGVHLTLFDAHDYTQAKGFERGYGLLNLSTLMILETVRQQMVAAGNRPPVASPPPAP